MDEQVEEVVEEQEVVEEISDLSAEIRKYESESEEKSNSSVGSIANREKINAIVAKTRALEKKKSAASKSSKKGSKAV